MIYASFINKKELKQLLRLPKVQQANRVLAGIVDTDKQILQIISFSRQIGQIKLKDIDNPNVPYRPDFADFEIVDYGFGLRFGQFEAAADWALWKAKIK